MFALNYHDRDYQANTIVMQVKGLITDVKKTAPQISNPKTLGDRVAAMRLKRGLTQSGLGTAAGVGQTTIANLEAGSRKSPRALLSIAQALGVTPQWIESGRGANPLIDRPIVAKPETSSDTELTIDSQSAPAGDVPMTAKFNPINVSNTIHLLGEFLGMYDDNSRIAIAGWLQKLVSEPGEASDIAEKMAGLARTQKPISQSAVVEAAMKRGRQRPVESAHAPLE